MEQLTGKEIEEYIAEANRVRGEALGMIRDLTKQNPRDSKVEEQILEWAFVAYTNYKSIVQLRKVGKEVKARKREEEAQAILSKYD